MPNEQQIVDTKERDCTHLSVCVSVTADWCLPVGDGARLGSSHLIHHWVTSGQSGKATTAIAPHFH